MDEKRKGELEDGRRKRAQVRRDAQAELERIGHDEGSSTAQKVAALRAVLLDTRKKPKRVERKVGEKITAEDVVRMRERLRSEPGEELLSQTRGDEKFLEKFKWRCERSLYFFAKFTGIAPDLSTKIHKEVAGWLQTWPEPGSIADRTKLLMLPTQHLKTAMASHGLPLHAIIQPKERNLYIPDLLGRNSRVALIGESTDKAIENLSVIENHLMSNVWIRNLWPECVWKEPRDASNWSRMFATVPREASFIRGEPTFTALGSGTAIYQRHWDIIICDDLIGWDAAGSPTTMADINQWRKGLITRRHSPLTSLMLFIGTHFTPNDIYVSMKSELPKETVISRSIVEEGEPIWPERFPMPIVEQLKKTMGMRLFSHLMMNLPTSEGFTGFDWNQVRLFEFEDGDRSLKGRVLFVEEEVDDEIRALYADPITQILSKWKKGAPLSSLYPSNAGGEFVDPYSDAAREKIGRMPFADQQRLKELSYLRGKYGEQGPYPDIERASKGGGMHAVEFRGPTTLIRRAPEN